MAPLILLLIAMGLFRGLGGLGVGLFVTWQDSARYALALMLLFTASAHFTPMKKDLARMMPERIPFPMQIIYFTGLCEVAGAFGILLPATRRIAGLCLVLLMIAVFPANVHAARIGYRFAGSRPRRSD